MRTETGHVDQTLSSARSPRCFLCAYDVRPCDIPSVEGTLLGIPDPGNAGRFPVVHLLTGQAERLSVSLPAHACPLIRELSRLPTEQLGKLRVRIFHLMRAGRHHGGLGSGSRQNRTLCTTPASAIVLEPDLLLNITDINNAEYCVRQYPLRRMAPSSPTAASLRGTIVHNAFKELLKGGGTGVERLDRALRAQAVDLALRQLSYDEVKADAQPHVLALEEWYRSQRHQLWSDALNVRAETFLLAPEVGLKGRLDFLLQDQRGDSLLELKTGRATAVLPKGAHRWQVHGYQTLLSVRHHADARHPGATLLYSGTPGRAEGYGIPFTLRDLHHVLDLRNRLALVHTTGLVPPPPGQNKCGKCALRGECQRAAALLGWEPPSLDSPPAPAPVADSTWFGQVYDLLRLEALATDVESRALWQLTPQQRCDAGIALGDLTQEYEPRRTESGEWEYTFRCANTSELREGDAILLSDGDPVRGAVVAGSILRLHEQSVTVWTPERIAHPSLIDRYDSDIVHTRTVRNLWRWLDVHPRLQALVWGDLEPEFDSMRALDDAPVDLNPRQRAALERTMAARDYALVQGPPGTGKTRVVAEIARVAVARGERVLIAGFTNQAVDTVLKRLLADGWEDIVRLGHALSVAPELHRYRLEQRTRDRLAGRSDSESPPDPGELRATLRLARIVAATAATWSAERFDDVGDLLRFDLAIVDEASQLTLPALLGPLRFARRFVLVGDERQLPPLVVSEEAVRRGLRRSVFGSLLDRWGDVAAVALTEQYRMHPVICEFPSQSFYAGRLEASGEARIATLDVALAESHPLRAILAPERPMVFVDVPAVLDAGRPGKTSLLQARVTARLVRALLDLGVPCEGIGVIAPYRAQVAALRQQLDQLEGNGVVEAGVTVDTVDRFQGGERRVILFSFGGHVPDDPSARGREFLADPHRLNVALTRAQRKLILLGDRRWLASDPLLARLVDYCAGLYGGRGGCISARRAADPASTDIRQ